MRKKRKTWADLDRLRKRHEKKIAQLEYRVGKYREEVGKLWNEKNWLVAESRENKKRAEKSDEALYNALNFVNGNLAKQLWTGATESPIDRKIYTTPQDYAAHISNNRLVVVKK